MEKPLLACVGAIIGFSGAILTKIMCDAMNRDLANVLFGGLNTVPPAKKQQVTAKFESPPVEDLASCRGTYLQSDDTFNDQKKYKNENNAIIFHTKDGWKMNKVDDTNSFCFSNKTLAGGQWNGAKSEYGAITVEVSTVAEEKKVHVETTVAEVADLLRNAKKVAIVPGYGMAQARAQGIVGNLAATLQQNGCECHFIIHPVAGRMPGQMNVLLAEADVPHTNVKEMDEVKDQMSSYDVTFCIGSNDIVNSAAEEVEGCSIWGMPVIRVWESKKVVFMKRSMGGGYADLENPVFFKENTAMFLGDGKASTEKLVDEYKKSIV